MAEIDTPNTKRPDTEEILREFETRIELLESFCSRTKTLIEAGLEEEAIPYHSIQVRVKSKKKLREKFEDPTKGYTRLDDLTDLAGLRVITYYEDDIERVSAFVKREFDVDWKNSVDKRDIEPDRFGYKAINFICSHQSSRTRAVEYKKFSGVKAEIQVTSILGHAWSEIEHRWYDLKDKYPSSVRRRFSRMAALLETADSEFVEIRKIWTKYERSVAVRVDAKDPELLLEPVSLKSFIERDPLVAALDQVRAATVGGIMKSDVLDAYVENRVRELRTIGLNSIDDVRESLARHEAVLPQFINRMRREVFGSVKPGVDVPRGVCLWDLFLLIVSLQKGDDIGAAMRAVQANVSWDLNKQVRIAREVTGTAGFSKEGAK